VGEGVVYVAGERVVLVIAADGFVVLVSTDCCSSWLALGLRWGDVSSFFFFVWLDRFAGQRIRTWSAFAPSARRVYLLSCLS
jgi:hypothetical protein